MGVSKRTSLRSKLDKKQSKISTAATASTPDSSARQILLDRLVEKKTRLKVAGFNNDINSTSISQTYIDLKNGGKIGSGSGSGSSTTPNFAASGISKSAIRRRKRKLRDSLKPKLDDLLDALPVDVQDVTNELQQQQQQQRYVASGDISVDPTASATTTTTKNKLNHQPNFHRKGSKLVEKMEMERFGKILKDENFKTNPFASLKEAILKNTEKY
ncbi:hypothetical protein CANARDRAFT_10201 [[Candida] arabinofermentans NRRL YB-2248]|uniref:Ribosome biogenesis protein SLX9 n=1 Tax=[Candida] arabinofermentans NRRL YB-2248 TaxID=983967 RepID=A0A1E4STS4_9ASCO|nr:hypothetical protein CANARDRAFT_10201 [[Candida] arabinofermentans NRRL YB-2248]